MVESSGTLVNTKDCWKLWISHPISTVDYDVCIHMYIHIYIQYIDIDMGYHISPVLVLVSLLDSSLCILIEISTAHDIPVDSHESL